MTPKLISVGGDGVAEVAIGGETPLAFLGGPCAIESRDHALQMAARIGEICARLDIPWIYKSCYDKDCRSSVNSFHGIGMEEGLEILAEVRGVHKVPVVCDFSEADWAAPTGEVVDMVQVPAYLCRQTHILKSAGETGKPVHLKKGQFMSPWNMKNSVRKIEATGNHQILLTDRGTFFGYNMLINDYRNFPIMAETGYPVCFDATHSVQLPTSMGNVSGGQREFIPHLVRAAAGCGINALFMEVHDNPDQALSDPNTQLDIRYLENILAQAKATHAVRLELLQKWGEDRVHLDA
ncbi:MAG: 3-deoxy-8-phosphooctulonate synthase [Rhodospirillales bacterium]|jgi:2-dehydro-3-deoxyphosphooctonate aldolase (KDO 8-P synthase)|nr:3-deoxy-8-phosphooctulonate synthase [Rhodospirillaceae bacterium]MDP6426899.1 3-deoxy-8-phosphooctulonate synthase [Rhodospirillales bacterium]MDP6643718.1 3-deoxy-8-phosphooctulonate synthase [Rhodospirillales bacterium]MDP6842768.1 3-deoxy-8-phosphooctulonate synthase [Rhodospirillales bacterium]|tara:strand:+ start:466 stop:1347 length:882 start_codon:yes stop_codon:yes gene_type:complete